MGKDRGINGTAGIKTKFDGPSRESGTESMVYLRHTNGNWAWGDVDGTSSGGPTNVLSITIQPDYRICAQQDVTPYFQLKMKRSWLVDILYRNSTTYILGGEKGI